LRAAILSLRLVPGTRLVEREIVDRLGVSRTGVRVRRGRPQKAAYRVLALTDLAERLPEIKAETLVMTGELDQGSNPRMARLMHAHIKGSILRILPVLRHSILIEAPDVVAGILDDFLAGRRTGS
jgi:pimeloyl-ACP methyl ester carboxylesterase